MNLVKFRVGLMEYKLTSITVSQIFIGVTTLAQMRSTTASIPSIRTEGFLNEDEKNYHRILSIIGSMGLDFFC